jgi:excinuclease UvrABC nuclease subunit
MVHFGGNKGIKHATLEQLKSAPGVGKSLASRIYDYFHPT